MLPYYVSLVVSISFYLGAYLKCLKLKGNQIHKYIYLVLKVCLVSEKRGKLKDGGKIISAQHCAPEGCSPLNW